MSPTPFGEKVARRIASGLTPITLARISCPETKQPCGHPYAEHVEVVVMLLEAGWDSGSADELLTDGKEAPHVG